MQEIVGSLGIDAPRDPRHAQKLFDLRAENKVAFSERVEKRFDAEGITREKQPPVACRCGLGLLEALADLVGQASPVTHKMQLNTVVLE